MRGKEIRLERIMDRNTGRTIIVPLDHGVTLGPIPGLVDLGATIDLVADGGANAVIGHVGLALHGHRGHGQDVGLIMHLSASTSIGPDPNDKVLVNTVTNALKMVPTVSQCISTSEPTPRQRCLKTSVKSRLHVWSGECHSLR